ncbi:hypothetical protein ACFL5V_09935 [Fibrobacterota bacterium]
MDANKIIEICNSYKLTFEKSCAKIKYENKGIFYSEMLLFCALTKHLKVNNIYESGRARGQSTEILASFFCEDPFVKIISVEYNKFTSDSFIASERLKKYGNVQSLFGNSFLVLSRIIKKKPSIILIDGPKGHNALLLAAKLFKNTFVKAVFIHDSHKDSQVRKTIEKLKTTHFASDNKLFVNNYQHFDNNCWDEIEYQKPYQRQGIQVSSYGPTLTVLFNENDLDLERMVIKEIGYDLEYKSPSFRYYLDRIKYMLPKFLISKF